MTSIESDTGAVVPGRWLWLVGAPSSVRRFTQVMTHRCGQWLSSPIRYWAWVVIAGLLPMSLAYGTMIPPLRLLIAVSGVPLLICSAWRDSHLRGLGGLLMVFLLHSGVVTAIAYHDPIACERLIPMGMEYWEETRLWIDRGISSQYDPQQWGPNHLFLMACVVLSAYLSLGAATLAGGLEQVDRMNVYFGRLLAESDGAWSVALLGWHPWSICRGIGYLFLMFESVSLSLERLTGRPLSTIRRRRLRWGCGLAFLAIDAGLKYGCTEPVRQLLHCHLPSYGNRSSDTSGTRNRSTR